MQLISVSPCRHARLKHSEYSKRLTHLQWLHRSEVRATFKAMYGDESFESDAWTGVADYHASERRARQRGAKVVEKDRQRAKAQRVSSITLVRFWQSLHSLFIALYSFVPYHVGSITVAFGNHCTLHSLHRITLFLTR
jgi:hypothetical protein